MTVTGREPWQPLAGSSGLVFVPNAPHSILAAERETEAGGRSFLETLKMAEFYL